MDEQPEATWDTFSFMCGQCFHETTIVALSEESALRELLGQQHWGIESSSPRVYRCSRCPGDDVAF